jgi:hypothetical protein
MKVAGNRAAGGTWDPKVGAASVEDDLEFLGGRSESDGAEVCSGLAEVDTRLPEGLTLRIQKILDWNVMAVFRVDGGVPEDVLRHSAHGLLSVFMAQGPHVVVNVGSTLSQASVCLENGTWVGSTHKLLTQRHLLELHAMHAGIGGTEQRSCCDDEGILHGDNRHLTSTDDKGGDAMDRCCDEKPIIRRGEKQVINWE